MGTLTWLASAVFEVAEVGWPLALLALLAMIPPTLALRLPATDARRHSVRAAQKGWWFPASLMLSSLALSPFEISASQFLLRATFVLLFSLPVSHVVWLGLAIRRSGAARAAVFFTAIAQLCVHLLLFFPALGLATGFGRTWR